MLLNVLKNHEIRPYFWSMRAAAQGPVGFHFLDLEVLKRALTEGTITDEALEELLYGTDVQRRYSGWTLPTLKAVSAQCGFVLPDNGVLPLGSDVAQPGPWVPRGLLLEPVSWSVGKTLQARLEQSEQRLWAWRKRLRLRTIAAKSRVNAALKPADLTKNGLRLNLGAGDENYSGYIKVDRAGTQHVYDDIVTLRRIRDGSVAEIYTNHVLEHIPGPAIAPLLKRWKEVLAPGGRIVARMPDARQSVVHLGEQWVEASDSEIAQHGLPHFLAKEATRKGRLDDQCAIQLIYGWSGSTPFSWDDVNQHKTLWTPGLARKRFEEAGFSVKHSANLGTLNTLIVAINPTA
jgi:hypothetical protein